MDLFLNTGLVFASEDLFLNIGT
jgi:hypothetical protein